MRTVQRVSIELGLFHQAQNDALPLWEQNQDGGSLSVIRIIVTLYVYLHGCSV